MAVESEHPVGAHRILGFGAMVFVVSDFADREIASPRPGLNARLIASIAEERRVVLDAVQLRRANTFEGLSCVTLYTSWRRGIALAEAQLDEIRRLFAAKALEDLSGYRLRVMLTELVDPEQIAFAASWRVFRIVPFQHDGQTEGSFAWTPPRAMGICERREALATPGSVAALVFHYSEPVIHFGDADRELLQAALAGATDGELVKRLGLTMSALKKRWASLYRRVAAANPDLIPEADDDPDRLTRGRQKRHHVLTYVREHPEELRPHERPRRREQPKTL
jgi:hypothetical protein